jgi:kinesin family protein C1
MDCFVKHTQPSWEVQIGATFVEIYNETIFDLLRQDSNSNNNNNNNKESSDNKRGRMLRKPSSTSLSSSSMSSSSSSSSMVGGQTAAGSGMKHEIKHAADKRFRITNTRNVPITQFAHVQDLLQTANTNRSVAATQSNAQSSRSHSIFSLYIDAKHTDKNCVLSGSLSMCDLAGSERLSKSKASGDRLKETQAINKSLSSLADVFSALRSGNDHVPYRNSKLTYMLQPCFASGGKTMMVINLSSEQEHMNETLCSLRFANQVNSTVVEKAKRRIRSSSSSK